VLVFVHHPVPKTAPVASLLRLSRLGSALAGEPLLRYIKRTRQEENFMPFDPRRFRDRINGELERRKWSRRELARRASLSETTVRQICTGTVRAPQIDVVTAIAKALDMPIDNLVDGA
jgi:transcriptional regulator with XRE-family HTH domain